MKRTIAHALFGFFVLMACLGVLSRALEVNATALVTVAKPEARVIAQSGEAEGAEPTHYDCCIATSAVHSDASGQSFVLVVETRAGFLGEELAVRRVNVRMETTDGAVVALATGDLSPQQQVVVRASRELNDGDKVRLADV